MTKELLQQALSYDPETGAFCWLVNRGRFAKIGVVAGAINGRGYRTIKVYGKQFYAHRLAWLISFGEISEGMEIDHIDGNKSNNKLANLRAVTRTVNQQNKHKPLSSNTSGFLGVSKDKNGWRSMILVKGKRLNLGTFAKPKDAHHAYIHAKRQNHEGCTI